MYGLLMGQLMHFEGSMHEQSVPFRFGLSQSEHKILRDIILPLVKYDFQRRY